MRKIKTEFDPTDRCAAGGDRLPALATARHVIDITENNIPMATLDRATKKNTIRIRAAHRESDYRRVVDALVYNWDLLAGMGYE